MHRLVAEHPTIVELDKIRAKAKAKAEADEAEITQAWHDYRDAMAHAARNGAPMPPAPERDGRAIVQEQRERDATLSRLRDEAFVEHADEMLELMLAREQELLDEAAPLAKRLNEISDELTELVGTTKHIARRGRHWHAGMGPIEGIYDRGRVDVGVLIVATEQEWRFLAPPLAPAPSSRPAGHYNPADLLVVHGGSM